MTNEESVSFPLQPVQCGKTRCYSKETGRLCRFVRTVGLQQYCVCALFEQGLIEDKEHCLKRCKQCLKAENETENK